jgi:drug/metabolite transporter (DMT)-like permease
VPGALPPFEKLSLCFAVAFAVGLVVLAARGRAVLGLAGTAILLARGNRFDIGTNMAWLSYVAATAGAVVWAGYSTLNRRFACVPSTLLVGVCGAVATAGLLCHVALEPWIMPAWAE